MEYKAFEKVSSKSVGYKDCDIKIKSCSE